MAQHKVMACCLLQVATQTQALGRGHIQWTSQATSPLVSISLLT